MEAYKRVYRALTALKMKDYKSALGFLEVACAEVSFLELRYCEAKFGDHNWVDQEPDIMMEGDWQECSRCGCARITSIPPELEVVQ